MTIRRTTSALVVGLLLVAAAVEAYLLGKYAYYSYYFFPKFKDMYIAPTRWQDFVEFTLNWGEVFLLFYLSYRLLKYALR
jgi:hypothetical protein